MCVIAQLVGGSASQVLPIKALNLATPSVTYRGPVSCGRTDKFDKFGSDAIIASTEVV